jgi:predicted dehydrogenase
MDCLIIGCSRFARRRVLPALVGLDGIDAVHVASRSATDAPTNGRRFHDYEEALDATLPGLVYVSLTNDAHARWAEAALARGHHVVVDKPAFTDLATAERLVALARSRSLVLAEATTYGYHPVMAELRRVFAEHGSAPTHVTCALTPPIPADDFRHRKALGGGALLDLGPYAASLGRVIWGVAPAAISACSTHDGEVDISFSLLARYGGGRVLAGHFGFDTEYCNWIHLLGPSLAVEARGVFSTPPDAATEITVRHRDAITVRTSPPAPAMRLFLAAVLAAIARGHHAPLAQTLLNDARVLDRLRHAADGQ